MQFSHYAPSLDQVTRNELIEANVTFDNLHISVAAFEKRRALSSTHMHVCSAHIPASSILRISNHVYIASPELLFFQKAREKTFSLERLILLGYGLCGKFALVNGTCEKAELVQIRPRTSIERISSFLDAIEKMNSDHERSPRGLARARRALSFVLGPVESPAEGRIAMLEFLPVRLGGEAVWAPECNGVVKLPPEMMKATGRSSFRCDFLWREQKVVLEYNGAHHGASREVARDAEKYNALSEAGFKVIIAAQKHISDPVHTETLAKQLKSALGQRAPRVTGNRCSYRERLRHELGLLHG